MASEPTLLLAFTVPGRPVSWSRTTVDRGEYRTPKGSRAAKRKIQLCAQVAARTARIPPPSSIARYEVVVRSWYPDERHGDVDRAAGLILDALEGIVYVADRQVKRLVVDIGTDRVSDRVDVEVWLRAPVS